MITPLSLIRRVGVRLSSPGLEWWTDVLRRRRHAPMVIGAILVAVFLVVAVLAPVLCTYDPMGQDVTSARQSPSELHWFGTDQLGRDVYSRIVTGARITLVVSLSTLVIAFGVGMVIGLLSGYLGGLTDRILMRLIDMQLAIPSLVLALVIVSVLSPGLLPLVLVVSVMSYPSFARLTRAVTLRVKAECYVDAAVVVGASNRRIVLRHILPNVLPHTLVLATVTLGRVVLSLSSLGFLGFGVRPGEPEWGMMVSQARSLFFSLPYLVFFPGMAICLVVLGFNLLGDGLRDWWDPRLR